jgi:hypothetical protein
VRGGALNTPDLYVSARGIGGTGQGGFFSPGTAGFDGTGGTATVELTGTSSQIGLLAIDAGGTGGSGGSGASGGAGGNGTGGTATLLVQDGEPQIGELFVTAGGYAGSGGQAFSSESGGAGAGGAGGIGTGGTILVQSGPGGVLNLGIFSFDATGQGGAGGGGGSAGEGDERGGAGGDGGAGIGGAVELGTTGGTINVTNEGGLTIAAHGRGGSGGQGGEGDFETTAGGVGGAGGQGSGGIARINIAGGSLAAPSTRLDSSGFGGAGGAAGNDPSFFGNPLPGANGSGAGGISRITVTDGNGVSGNASLGSTTLVSEGVSGTGFVTAGDLAGRMIIEDLGTVAGGLQMADLLAISTGSPSPDGPAFEFTSTEGPVLVAGAVTISVEGDIRFSAAGTGGLAADGPLTASAGGSIMLDHSAPAPGAL